MAPITNGSQYNYLPYGVLKYHNAICVGNATTFKLFMDILGIDCKIIHSTENGEHAWDVVKLDDDWYHVDVTFDGGNNGKPGYNYFNVPDSVKDDGAYPWNHDEIPAADGVKYCYVYHNAGNLADVYAVPKYVKQQIKKGSTLISFTLKDNSGYTSETSEYITSALSTDSGAYYSGNVMWISLRDSLQVGASTTSKTILVWVGPGMTLRSWMSDTPSISETTFFVTSFI